MGLEDNENFDMAGAVDVLSSELGFGELGGDDSGLPDLGGNATPPAADSVPASGQAGEGAGTSGEAPDAGTGTPPGGSATPPGGSTPAVTAPRTWRPEAAAHWANLPPEVQQEIAKREEDIFKGIEGYKADAHYGKTMQNVMAPFAQVMKQYNIDPVQQVAGLMNAHYTLALGTPEAKVNLMRQLMTDYKIDPASLGGQPDQTNPYADPEVIRLRQELAELKSGFNGIQSERAAQQRQAIEGEVSKFVADPANVYVKEVVNDMARLLSNNQAATVKEAYEQAMWLNPAVRAKEIARQQTEQASKAAKEAAEKAAAAKKALAANVKSSAKARGAAAPVGSMDDTLMETLADIQARG